MNLVTKLLSSTSSFGLEFGVIKPRSISSCRCFSAALSGSFGGRPRGFLGFGDFFVGGLPRFFFPSEPGVGFGGLRDIFTFSSESFFCDSESDLPLSLYGIENHLANQRSRNPGHFTQNHKKIRQKKNFQKNFQFFLSESFFFFFSFFSFFFSFFSFFFRSFSMR